MMTDKTKMYPRIVTQDGVSLANTRRKTRQEGLDFPRKSDAKLIPVPMRLVV